RANRQATHAFEAVAGGTLFGLRARRPRTELPVAASIHTGQPQLTGRRRIGTGGPLGPARFALTRLAGEHGGEARDAVGFLRTGKAFRGLDDTRAVFAAIEPLPTGLLGAGLRSPLAERTTERALV